MAKTTMLDIVQQILSDADGDNVNSISDTVESDQCSRLVRDVFDQIVTGDDLYVHKTVKQLTATSATTPCVMTRPERFTEIEWIKYDVRAAASDDQKYVEVTYRTPSDFINLTSMRSDSATEIDEVTLTDSGHVILCYNERAPKYWTILEGYDRIVFDAYDGDLETNLQTGKSLAYGKTVPTLALTDTAVPDLPQNQMVHLKREARAMYFDLYKDGLTAEVDRTRRRAEVRMQRLRRVHKNLDDNQVGPHYGRK